MAEEVKVKPTPIQRNALDVATELTQMYCHRKGIDSAEEVQTLFIKFYSVAISCEWNKIDFDKYVQK